jgi:hypothetical protein
MRFIVLFLIVVLAQTSLANVLDRGKKDIPEECIIPFFYNGEWHDDCIADPEGPQGSGICANVEYPSDPVEYRSDWEYCDECFCIGCQISSVGTCCATNCGK